MSFYDFMLHINVTAVSLQSSLMCVTFHPRLPSIIAGGTFSGLSNETHLYYSVCVYTCLCVAIGEVIVWDTSKEEESVVALSGIGDESHKEAVAKVGDKTANMCTILQYRWIECSQRDWIEKLT